MRGSKRLSFVLPASSYERLERIKEIGEWTNNAEPFKVALRLLEDAMTELAEGSTITITKRDGEQRPYNPLLLAPRT